MSDLPILSDDDRRELTDPRTDYTAEDRVFFAMTYLLARENSALAAARVSRATGTEMDGNTFRSWKRRPWWQIAIKVAKRYLQKELDAKYTAFIHATEEQMMDRVLNGETRVIQTRDAEGKPCSERVKVPVTLRDLVGAHALVAEQRARIRGVGQKEAATTGLDLAMKLAEMLQQQGERKIKDSIPGEFTVEVDDVKAEFTDRDGPGGQTDDSHPKGLPRS